MTRRQMLASLLGIGAGTGLSVGSLSSGARLSHKGSGLEPDRRRALAAACERVLPGAVEAGVPEYIDHWIVRQPFARFVRPLFRIGAVHLDRLAKQKHGKPFADCRPAQQDAILKLFERGALKAKNFRGQRFFEHLVRLTLEGFFCDPKYGGNRGGVGWKFIGRTECWWQPRHLELILKTDQGLAY